MKLAILDDYQRMALGSADWERLRRRGIEITAFERAFASPDEAAERLAPFEILSLMRERTPFPRALIERLPNLRFISLTGMRAAMWLLPKTVAITIISATPAQRGTGCAAMLSSALPD